MIQTIDSACLFPAKQVSEQRLAHRLDILLECGQQIGFPGQDILIGFSGSPGWPGSLAPIHGFDSSGRGSAIPSVRQRSHLCPPGMPQRQESHFKRDTCGLKRRIQVTRTDGKDGLTLTESAQLILIGTILQDFLIGVAKHQVQEFCTVLQPR